MPVWSICSTVFPKSVTMMTFGCAFGPSWILYANQLIFLRMRMYGPCHAIFGLTLLFSLRIMQPYCISFYTYKSYFLFIWLVTVSKCSLAKLRTVLSHNHLHPGGVPLQGGQKSVASFLYPASSWLESNRLNCDQLSDKPLQGRECADPSPFGCGLHIWPVVFQEFDWTSQPCHLTVDGTCFLDSKHFCKQYWFKVPPSIRMDKLRYCILHIWREVQQLCWLPGQVLQRPPPT